MIKNIFGFRSNKLWKKILAGSYYLFCIIYLINSLMEIPIIEANFYDTFIYKLSVALKSLSFLFPVLLLSNFKIKDKIPILKNKKWWSDVFGFILAFIITFICSELVYLCHTNDYLNRYEEYNVTKINYQHQENNKTNEDEIINSENNNNENNENSNVENNEVDNNTVENTDNNNTNSDDNNNNVTNNNDSSKEEIKENENNGIVQNDFLKIHYIDVGQGDSIFIELPNGQNMLIDAGTSSKGKIVVNYIKDLGYKKINYLIGTHPHADHIGGLANVISNFTIEKIYMPKAVSTSKTYENLLTTIAENNLKVTTANAGANILSNGNLKINIIAPNKDYSDLNDYSAVIKIIYGNKKFLFMGDAETTSENDITADVSADVIKVGHHGSDTSSGQEFINKVNAQYAIISVGTGNQYNHPYQIILDRWTSSGAKVYRTDLHGTIIVKSNGNSLEINTTK